METVKIERTTKETSVYAEISFPGKGDVSVNTTVPFFDHMLTALFFHGGFDAKVKESTIITWLKTQESSSVNVWPNSTNKVGRQCVSVQSPYRWMMQRLPF